MVDALLFTKVLGRELRKVRRARRIGRDELISGLDRTVSLATISTYEQGTRYISLVRFVEICTALGVSALEVFERAYDHVAQPAGTHRLSVDLTVIARSDDSVLTPVRNWAGVVLRTASRKGTTVHLGNGAVVSLATLCGVGPDELVARLTRTTTDQEALES